MSEEISTSEMLGELRRMHRTFKSFERAVDIAENIKDHEDTVNGLKSDANFLKAERAKLNDECDDLVSKISIAKSDLSSLDETVKRKLSEAEEKAEETLNSARERAEQIVNTAKDEADNINSHIKSLQDEEKKAIAARNKANAEMEEAKRKLREFKAQLVND